MSRIDEALSTLGAARSIASPHARLLALRNAGEALAEALRAGPSVAVETLRGPRLALETRIALPALRLPLTFVALERRAWRIGALVIDAFAPGEAERTPFGERFGQRHPRRRSWLSTGGAGEDSLDGVKQIVLTSLRHRSLALLLARFPEATIRAHPAEHARYRDPPPSERALYERSPVLAHERLVLAGPGVLMPGLALIETPGLGGASCSVVANDGETIRVLSPHGVALDAWSPYESSLAGLREAVRLHDVEAVPRGDADPVESSISMGLERVLADRRAGAPAFHDVTPSLELVPSALAPIGPTLRAR
jgi:hypothetical protein